MKATRIIFVSLILLTLGACSMMGERVKPVSVTTIAKQQPMYHLDNLKKGEAPKRAFYSLSSKEYEHLSMDIADITRYIKEVLGIIKFYRDYDTDDDEDDER